MSSLLRRLCLVLAGLAAAAASAQVTITLNNSGTHYVIPDPARDLVYVGESSNAATNYLYAISTTSNSIVGSYSFNVGSGYTAQVAYNNGYLYWADQGNSQVRVVSVDSSGTMAFVRTDSMTAATGIAALSTTYGVNLQGTGDVLRVVTSATGSTVGSFNYGLVAGNVWSDSNTNLYYATTNSGVTKVINASASLVGTLSGAVQAIDSNSGHNFVYMVPSGSPTVLQQLTGSGNTATGESYNFGSGATITTATVDQATGNVYVSLQNQKVVALNSSLDVIAEYTYGFNPGYLGVADGNLYVSNNTSLTVTAIPEPGTWGAMAGVAGLALAMWKRRSGRKPIECRPPVVSLG
jgi:hypothetical protein